MNNKNDNLISTITVRLKKDESSALNIGTGILYYEEALNDQLYLLTASHCLFEDGDRYEKLLDSICVDIYNPKERKYKSITIDKINKNLLSRNKNEDVAVIILKKEEIDLINDCIPKIQVIKVRESFDIFKIKGFPKATRGEELAVITAKWLQEMTETNRFQLQVDADYSETNIEGLSGAGIFLEANSEVYLYGILTRYRGEEKGKVIYCQYIDKINKYLTVNFLPLIKYTYLGENELTHSYFKSQVNREIKNLGPRFNEKINIKLPIIQQFNSISKNREYHKNIITKTDKWLTENRCRKLKNYEFIAEIENELEALLQEIEKWIIEFNDHLVDTEITLRSLVNKVKILNDKISNKWHEIDKLDNKDKKDKSKKALDFELSRLIRIQDTNREFMGIIEDLNVNLANHPTLIIKGEAGCGKSHLLGDIATQRNKQNLPTILLLGTTFVNTTIEQNILNKLDLKCSFKDFLSSLNSIGLQINSRTLILIDAINEGAGVDLWKNQIAGFIDEIAKYPAVGVVLTIRDTYFNDIIPTGIKQNPNITITTHKGFKGNEYEALKLFCEYHKLKLPNFPFLNPEFSNPLFLHLICEAVKQLPDRTFPKGINGINETFKLYKNSLNKKFEEKRSEYKHQEIVLKAIDKIALAIFNTDYESLSVSDAVELMNTEFPKFPHLFSDLIEESVLIKTRGEYNEDLKDIILFSYQRLGDFFMAEELIKPYKSKKEIKNAFANDRNFQKITYDYHGLNTGILEALAILLPEKYNLELFELIDFFLDNNHAEKNSESQREYIYESFDEILLNSLIWRDINKINYKKINNWVLENGLLTEDKWWNTLTELAAIPNHPFNGDSLHRILLNYSMSDRDSFWQEYVFLYVRCDDNNIGHPLRRLIDWAWTPNISNNIDIETARLVAQTLAWVLSSTRITLRDETTKALVNLLEQQPEALIKVLTAFEKINDLYILDRLYAVAYGCILRTEKDDFIKIIAQYIYDTIFKNGNPTEHILIRDYARNAIEYAIYKNIKLEVDVTLIHPPYHSRCNYTPLSDEKIDKKYKPKENNGNWEKKEWGITAILDSMTTEYGRGIGHYGNFGRYIFQSLVSEFKLPNKLNVNSLSNLAVEWIFEKYGYNPQKHGEYDNMTCTVYNFPGYERERIGKKYQWIALYQILAIISDNYKIRNSWPSNKYSTYKGIWQLSVRNIDPGNITKNKNENENDDNHIKHNNKEWWGNLNYNHWNHPDAEWVKLTSDLISPLQIIEKKDTNSEKWIQLQHDIKWQEPKKNGVELYSGRKKQIRYNIQALLVKKSEKLTIINYLKDMNFWDNCLPENRDNHSNLILREKFWSPAYLDQYKKRTWETIQNTKHRVIVSTESANGQFENDKSGANLSYNIPCKYIFEGMKLQYEQTDGNLKNANNETIVMSSNSKGVLMRKKDLIQFLENNDLDIIWTLLGEKRSYTNNPKEELYFTVPCGVYYLIDGKLKGKIKIYNRN